MYIVISQKCEVLTDCEVITDFNLNSKSVTIYIYICNKIRNYVEVFYADCYKLVSTPYCKKIMNKTFLNKIKIVLMSSVDVYSTV